MNITSRQIEIFRWLMISGTATSAAKALNTSQPTVSRELKELEYKLGFRLFEREKGRLLPTAEAMSLSVVVEHAYVGLEHITRTAIGIRDYGLQHINIACLPAFAHACLPYVCHNLSQEMPGIRISINSAEEQVLQKEFFTKRYNIALVETAFTIGDSTVETLDAGELVAMLPSGHPLCHKNELTPKDFHNINFINFNADDIYRRELDKVFSSCNVMPFSRIETITAVGVSAMVQSGLGVSIVNPLTALAFHGQGVELRKFSPSIPYELQAIKISTNVPHKITERFLVHIRKYVSDCRHQLRDYGLL